MVYFPINGKIFEKTRALDIWYVVAYTPIAILLLYFYNVVLHTLGVGASLRR